MEIDGGKSFISDETKIRMFLRKLYEEWMISNDEYVGKRKVSDQSAKWAKMNEN